MVVEVYAVELRRAQQVQFRLTTPEAQGYISARLYNPGSISVRGDNSLAEGFSSNPGGEVVFDFTPAAAGTYYLELRSDASGQVYTLRVEPTWRRAAQRSPDVLHTFMT